MNRIFAISGNGAENNPDQQPIDDFWNEAIDYMPALRGDHQVRSIGIDEEYRSTLMGWAAREGQEDMVDILLKRGADPNGGEEWTKPLVWAERRGYKDVANALKKAGASA